MHAGSLEPKYKTLAMVSETQSTILVVQSCYPESYFRLEIQRGPTMSGPARRCEPTSTDSIGLLTKPDIAASRASWGAVLAGTFVTVEMILALMALVAGIRQSLRSLTGALLSLGARLYAGAV
jgi:hypothetical protein